MKLKAKMTGVNWTVGNRGADDKPGFPAVTKLLCSDPSALWDGTRIPTGEAANLISWKDLSLG